MDVVKVIVNYIWVVCFKLFVGDIFHEGPRIAWAWLRVNVHGCLTRQPEGGHGCVCGWMSGPGFVWEKDAEVRGHIAICPKAVRYRETGCAVIPDLSGAHGGD